MLSQAPVTGLYDLGPYARYVGLAALNRFDDFGHIHEAMRVFTSETGHALALYVWTDFGPVLIRLEPGLQSFAVSIRVGSVLPLCTSATGRAFLAHLPDTVTRPFIERERAEALRDGLDDPYSEALIEEIQQIKSMPLYVSRKAIIPGLAIVAPLFDARGSLVCMLTALAPRGATDTEAQSQLLNDLTQVVNKLSRQFRGS
jgi:DNA-binding IclR family transcriptional regulator